MMTVAGYFVSFNQSGQNSVIKIHNDWDSDWDLIIPGQFGDDSNTDLLFYKRPTGIGLFVRTNRSGNISTIKEHRDGDRNWDIIIPGNFGGGRNTDLLF